MIFGDSYYLFGRTAKQERDFFCSVGKHTGKFFPIQITKQLLLDVTFVQSGPTGKKQSESVASIIVTLDLKTDTVVFE